MNHDDRDADADAAADGGDDDDDDVLMMPTWSNFGLLWNPHLKKLSYFIFGGFLKTVVHPVILHC